MIGDAAVAEGSWLKAIASSSVIGLRLRSSSVKSLCRGPPPHRLTKATLLPNCSICSLTPDSSPFASEATPITVAVPITTPSTVRNDRNLCDHNVVIARLRSSFACCLSINVLIPICRAAYLAPPATTPSSLLLRFSCPQSAKCQPPPANDEP